MARDSGPQGAVVQAHRPGRRSGPFIFLRSHFGLYTYALDSCTCVCKYSVIYMSVHGQTDGQTDRPTDRQTDTQQCFAVSRLISGFRPGHTGAPTKGIGFGGRLHWKPSNRGLYASPEVAETLGSYKLSHSPRGPCQAQGRGTTKQYTNKYGPACN